MPETVNNNQTLEERMQQWEREKKGLITDLQAEREKRHSLEERLNLIENSIQEAENIQPESDKTERVNQLARDPDGFITSVVEPKLTNLEKRLIDMHMDRQYEKSYRWLAKAEKLDEEDIPGSELEKEIVRIVKERGMTSMNPLEGTKAAYKIYQQEKLEREQRERTREEAISGNATETVKVLRSSGPARFTASQIAQMSPAEYERNREAILEAREKGLISNK